MGTANKSKNTKPDSEREVERIDDRTERKRNARLKIWLLPTVKVMKIPLKKVTHTHIASKQASERQRA